MRIKRSLQRFPLLSGLSSSTKSRFYDFQEKGSILSYLLIALSCHYYLEYKKEAYWIPSIALCHGTLLNAEAWKKNSKIFWSCIEIFLRMTMLRDGFLWFMEKLCERCPYLKRKILQLFLTTRHTKKMHTAVLFLLLKRSMTGTTFIFNNVSSFEMPESLSQRDFFHIFVSETRVLGKHDLC